MKLSPDDRLARIMSSPVATVDPKATLRETAQLLHKADVGALVVLPAGRLPMGIVSERDVVYAVADGADPDVVRAADVMSEQPRYATPGQSIRSVTEEMLTAGVRHIPVVDDEEVVGMVAARDALRVLADAVPARGATGPAA